MSGAPGDVCSTCRRTREWHDSNTTVHPFTTPGDDSALGERRTTSQERPSATPVDAPAVMRWPFDPVLRQALIDKGVLTVEDLEEAEKKIITASAVMGQ